VINLKTAKALRLDIPDRLLAVCTENLNADVMMMKPAEECM
jgi:hypothetical protein